MGAAADNRQTGMVATDVSTVRAGATITKRQAAIAVGLALAAAAAAGGYAALQPTPASHARPAPARIAPQPKFAETDPSATGPLSDSYAYSPRAAAG